MTKLLIPFLLIACTYTAVIAQEVPAVAPADSIKIPSDTLKISADTLKVTTDTSKSSDDATRISKNFIKFNITSALIKNYSLQYERILSRGVSAAVALRVMPESGIPYTDNIFRWFDITDPETQEVIDNVIISNYAITPEIRFYTGKKRYGNGFYFTLFYRYGYYKVRNALIPYEQHSGNDIKLNSSGSASSHTGGFMIGAQWALGKHICLDWWILGPHFGISSGDVLGLPSAPLSEEDQQEIEDELNGIDFPMFKQTVEVTADKAYMIFDGPWAGIRTGLSIGVKF